MIKSNLKRSKISGRVSWLTSNTGGASRSMLLIFAIIGLSLSPVAMLAQAPAQMSEKEFTADLDAFIRKTMGSVPEMPSVTMVVIKDAPKSK